MQKLGFPPYILIIYEAPQKFFKNTFFSIFGDLSLFHIQEEISARMPLSQTFTKPISIHYGSPCFLNRFRITFFPFQEGPWWPTPRLFQDIFYFFGATCISAFYVIALMGNSCYVKSEILLNYCEAGYGNWHYVKTLHTPSQFILCHISPAQWHTTQSMSVET